MHILSKYVLCLILYTYICRFYNCMIVIIGDVHLFLDFRGLLIQIHYPEISPLLRYSLFYNAYPIPYPNIVEMSS